MSHYMTQFAYTAETWAALRANPVDRTATVTAFAEKLGCRLISLYYHFGEYDGLVIFEAPDDTVANAVVIAAIAPGHLKAHPDHAIDDAQRSRCSDAQGAGRGPRGSTALVGGDRVATSGSPSSSSPADRG